MIEDEAKTDQFVWCQLIVDIKVLSDSIKLLETGFIEAHKLLKNQFDKLNEYSLQTIEIKKEELEELKRHHLSMEKLSEETNKEVSAMFKTGTKEAIKMWKEEMDEDDNWWKQNGEAF